MFIVADGGQPIYLADIDNTSAMGPDLSRVQTIASLAVYLELVKILGCDHFLIAEYKSQEPIRSIPYVEKFR